MFNMFSRLDAPKWTKWKFYPAVVTILLPRLLIGIALAIILLVVVSVLLIGHKNNDPIKQGCRKFMLKFAYKTFAHSMGFITFWTVLDYEYVESSYDEYLGRQK